MDRLRIDKWLWAARFFKTRSLAADAVEKGRVRIGGAPVKPSKDVRVGDAVEIEIEHVVWRVDVLGIHHVGVAVVDLDEAVQTYERLFGGRLEHRERVDAQGVEAASIRVGDGRIELLASLGDDTPVGKFLAKRGPGMHHVAYEVDDVRVAAADLAAGGAELIDSEPRQGMFGLEVAFVHPESVHGVLTEVVSGG